MIVLLNALVRPEEDLKYLFLRDLLAEYLIPGIVFSYDLIEAVELFFRNLKVLSSVQIH